MTRLIDADKLVEDLEQATHVHASVGRSFKLADQWKHHGMARAYQVVLGAIADGAYPARRSWSDEVTYLAVRQVITDLETRARVNNGRVDEVVDERMQHYYSGRAKAYELAVEKLREALGWST